MNFRLDHVVIAVLDLAQAVDDYRALGFTVQMGGRHPGRTSHNALIVFEDGAYLELIGWPEPGIAERWYNELVKHGEGLMDFALIPDDVSRAVAESKERGLTMNGPIDGGRIRPDGVELKWQTGRQTTFDLPFLCADVTARDLRVPAGDVRNHANRAVGVAKLTVAVFDLDVSLARYRALLGTSAPTMKVGGTVIELTSFSPQLETRGEGACAMTIDTSGAHGTRSLDATLTHAAQIELT
jgi:catechol 2,3-dioxygenase-like lactoylglutathione lyase family enzyme